MSDTGTLDPAVVAYLQSLNQAQQSPVSSGNTVTPGSTGSSTQRLVDPSTGRPAFTGPNGEAGLAPGDPRGAYIPGQVRWTMPDGRDAWYVPNQNVQTGNVNALRNFNENGNGSSTNKPPDPNAPTPESEASAKSVIQKTLDAWGLGSLADWAWGLHLQGYDLNYITQEMYQRPEFKQRFPAIAARQAAGKNPISPAEYVARENEYDAVMQEQGLHGLFDRQSLYTSWISGDVSSAEAQARAKTAYQAAMGEPLDVRAELQRLYGTQAGGIATAYYLDPSNSLPKIQQQLQAGEIAGGSVRSGYGLLTAQEAEMLAAQGITGQQAQRGFGQLAGESQLFNPLPGETGGKTISQDQQIAAMFGDNASAQQAITQQGAARVAQVNSGGRFGINKSGVQGLGEATV